MLTFILRSTFKRFKRGAVLALLALMAPLSAQALEACVECHGVAGLSASQKPLWIHAESYEASIHGRLACSDCHKKMGSFPHLPERELRCDLPCHARETNHSAIWESERGGVHWGKDAISCVKCHDGAPARKKPQGDAVCRGCHGELEVPSAIYPAGTGDMVKRGHDRAAFEEKAPDCRSCHGHHGVGGADAARQSCLKEGCHPNENPKFGLLFTHKPDEPMKPWGGAKFLFLGLGALLALLLAAHAFKGGPEAGEEAAVAPKTVEVLDRIDLSLHLGAAAAVLILLGTGPFLQFPALSKIDPGTFAFVHGFAGVIAVIIWLGHFARVAMEWLEGRNPFGLVPKISDLGQMMRGVAFGTGLGKEPPVRGRYNYREKFSYVLLVAALPVMAVTGYLVSNPARLSGLLGPSGLMACAAIHSALGLLLVLPLVWHVFFSMFEPSALWFNQSLLTGRMEFSMLHRKRPDWAREILGGFEELKEQAPQEATKEVTVEELLEAGNEAARQGDLKHAAYYFLKALELYPGYSQALFNLGVVLYKSGDYRRSKMVLEKFLDQDPFGPASPKARELVEKMAREGGK